MRLLYRFFEPQQGKISIAGQDITDVDIDSLRHAIAIVPQVIVVQTLQVESITMTRLDEFVSLQCYFLFSSILLWLVLI